jgi:DNA-binding protein H-NS
MPREKKELMNTRDLLNEAMKVYYIQYKGVKDLEEQAAEKQQELEKLGGFLKSLGIDPEEVIRKKQAQGARVRKARAKKTAK